MALHRDESKEDRSSVVLTSSHVLLFPMLCLRNNGFPHRPAQKHEDSFPTIIVHPGGLHSAVQHCLLFEVWA